MKRSLRTGLAIASLLSGCTSGSQSTDASGDAATDTRAPMPVTVGADIDVRMPRTLSTHCAPPQPFYDALTRMGITPHGSPRIERWPASAAATA